MNRRRQLLFGAIGLSVGSATGVAVAKVPTAAAISISAHDYGALDGTVHVDGERSDLCFYACERYGFVYEYDLDNPGTLRRRDGRVRISWPDHPEIERFHREAWRE